EAQNAQRGAPGYRSRLVRHDRSSPAASGAGLPALDLDDDIAERLRPDIAQRMPQGPLVPAHDRARLHLDPIHRAIGVRALDEVALDDDSRVVEIVGVPPGGF